LAAQAGATATAAAPAPTPVTPIPEATPAPTFGDMFSSRLGSLAATALALLLVIGAVYGLLRVLRWLFVRLRDWWAMRLRPLFGQPPRHPSVAMGAFVDATGDPNYIETEIVAQTIEETLARWNAAVAPELRTPVHSRPLDRAGLSWLGTLWAQVTPPPRGYHVTGLLLGGPEGPHRLSVERLDLRSNCVDAAHSFESEGEPAEAFRAMAEAAAYWLRDPRGMEGAPETLEVAAGAPRVASEVVALLIPVRQQVTLESVEYPGAPQALDAAQARLATLPAGSSLRADLQASVDDLRAQVQPGRA